MNSKNPLPEVQDELLDNITIDYQLSLCPCAPAYHWALKPPEITSKISQIIAPFAIEELQRDQRNYMSLPFGCCFLSLYWLGPIFGSLIYISVMVVLFAMEVDQNTLNIMAAIGGAILVTTVIVFRCTMQTISRQIANKLLDLNQTKYQQYKFRVDPIFCKPFSCKEFWTLKGNPYCGLVLIGLKISKTA